MLQRQKPDFDRVVVLDSVGSPHAELRPSFHCIHVLCLTRGVGSIGEHNGNIVTSCLGTPLGPYSPPFLGPPIHWRLGVYWAVRPNLTPRKAE